ncbi:MAG: hypothetical protein J6B24_05940 [Clostridia bacterium]|nr:hypothetical protein [Clostridia bacterium]
MQSDSSADDQAILTRSTIMSKSGEIISTETTAAGEAVPFPSRGLTLSDSACRTLARALVRTVRAYYRDPAHRAEFEAWYLERYGKPYQWNKKGGPAP